MFFVSWCLCGKEIMTEIENQIIDTWRGITKTFAKSIGE